jgi:hypothetical protein
MSFSVPYLLLSFLFFCGAGVSLSRAYASLSQGWLWGVARAAWSASPKQIWNQQLAAQEPSWFLSLMWQGFNVRASGSRCQCFASPWWFFSAKCGSSVSARVLIYGSHSVCFLPLVTILDFPQFLDPFISCRAPGSVSKIWLLQIRLQWTLMYRCLYCILSYVPLGRWPGAVSLEF